MSLAEAVHCSTPQYLLIINTVTLLHLLLVRLPSVPAVFIVTVRALFLRIYCVKISKRQSLKPIERFTFHIKINPSVSTKASLLSFDTLLIKTFLIYIYIHSQSEPSLQINLAASISLSAASRPAAAEAGRLP